MKLPKIAIVVSRDGVETISVLSSDPRVRKEGFRLCEEISEEIAEFERIIKQKFQKAEEAYHVN